MQTLKPRVNRTLGNRLSVMQPGGWRTNRSTAHERGYGRAWQAARLAYLRQHPLCVDCIAEGHTGLATEVDHERPHRGDPEIFWDRDNWRGRCKPHHSAKTARGQ